MRRVQIILAIALILPGSAFASLHFDHLDATFTASLDQNHADVAFKFTNDGDKPVLIKNVTTSCGCTTAQTDRQIYLPGELGTVSATVQLGAAEGRLDKTITIETDDAKSPTVELSVHVVIPKLVSFSPNAYVRWDVHGEATPKTVDVAVEAPFSLKIVGVKSWHDKMHATLKEIEAGKKYQIIVWPTDTADEINTGLELLTEANWPGKPKTIWLLAHVKPAAQN